MLIHLIVILVLVDWPSIMSENQLIGSAYIDAISNEYLAVEETLWNQFENVNQSDLVLKIHTEHLTYFRNSFSIERKRTENFKENFETFFGWEVLGLNSEVEFVRNFELRDAIEDISMDDTIQMAKSYVEYTGIIEKLYNATVDQDVFKQIKQVQHSALG